MHQRNIDGRIGHEMLSSFIYRRVWIYRLAMTVLYRDYGDAVTVNPPPADQVGDVTDRIGQFLRGR